KVPDSTRPVTRSNFRQRQGSEHTNMEYGGMSAGKYGEGAVHTNLYGGSSAHAYEEAPSIPTPTVAARMVLTGRAPSIPTHPPVPLSVLRGRPPSLPPRTARRPTTPRTGAHPIRVIIPPPR